MNKALFLHVPKLTNHYAPYGDFISIIFMPMGLLGLADIARKKGWDSEVIHLGVEWIHSNRPKSGLLGTVDKLVNRASGAHVKPFSIVDYVAEHKPKLIGLSLFWHYQSFDTLDVATRIKAVSPDTFVLLGGFTASVFPDEILENFPAVDGIIRGQGEVPLARLLDELDREKPELASVPNLVWRDEQIRTNAHTWSASTEDLAEFRTTDMTLLRNHDLYIQISGFPLVWMKHAHLTVQRDIAGATSYFPLFIGRGCAVSCAYCGGGKGAHRKVTLSNHVLWQEPDQVIDAMEEAVSFGYDGMYVCFDPEPRGDYFPKLFRRMRERGFTTRWYFECWGLPTEEFVDEFTKTFPDETGVICLSPESGVERVRRRNKGFPYTDAEFYTAMDMLGRYEVPIDLFFSVGMPFEKYADAMETRAMIRNVRKLYKMLRWVMVMPMQMEPGSPMFNRPDKYKVLTTRRNFMDFFEAHKSPYTDPMTCLGYVVPDFFPGETITDMAEFDRRIGQIRCEHFCLLLGDRDYDSTIAGQVKCKAMDTFWRVKGAVPKPGQARPIYP